MGGLYVFLVVVFLFSLPCIATRQGSMFVELRSEEHSYYNLNSKCHIEGGELLPLFLLLGWEELEKSIVAFNDAGYYKGENS